MVEYSFKEPVENTVLPGAPQPDGQNGMVVMRQQGYRAVLL